MLSEIYNKIWIKAFYSDTLRKMYLWTLKHRPLRFLPYPTAIELEPTTFCNLRCRICENPIFSKRHRRNMTLEEFKYIIDQFPNLKWCGATGIGEQWLNPDFGEMLKYAKSKKIFIEAYDNFVFFDEDRIKEVLKYDLYDRLYFSIDAATKETYEKIRVGAKWEVVINNFKTFIELKEKFNKKKPKLDFHFVVCSLNLNELPEFIKLVGTELRPKGRFAVHFVKILHKFDWVKDIYVDHVPQDIIQKTEEMAKKYNVYVQWEANIIAPQAKHAWRRELPPIKNCYAWMSPFIFVDGNVMPCCTMNEGGWRDRQIQLSMGNIFEKPFKEIWYGPRYMQLKRMIRANLTPPYCVGCPFYYAPPTPKEIADKFLPKEIK